VKWILRRRPSPALVISLIALFLSLGGVSYGFATGSINSREIKNNDVRSRDLRNNQIRTFDLRNNEIRGIDVRNSTVQGRDVALNTLGGDDINESRLGKVPSAAQADSATSAASATTATTAGSVGGVRLQKIAYSAATGSAFATVLDLGGLRLEARCQTGPDLEVRATTALQNSEIFSTFPTPGPMSSDPDFDAGENFAAVPAGATVTDSLGTIAFAGSDGSVVTADAHVVEQPNDIRGSTTDDCGFFGIAEAG
jgi:hypothetical protein